MYSRERAQHIHCKIRIGSESMQSIKVNYEERSRSKVSASGMICTSEEVMFLSLYIENECGFNSMPRCRL